MASRVVEVLYKLKDLFTPTAKKVEKFYENLGKSAERAAEQVDETNDAVGSTLERLGRRFTQLKIAAGFAAIGSAARAAVEGIQQLAEGIRSVVRAGRRIGGTAQDFLDIQEAAAALGADAGKVTSQLERLQRQLNSAAAGSARVQERFARLGIDFRELERLAPDERIARLAGALRSIDDRQEGLARLAQLIGGEAGTGLQLLIEQAPESLADTLAVAKETGEVIDEEVVAATERWLRFTNQITQSWDRFIGQLREVTALTAGGLLEIFGAGDDVTQLQRAEQRLADVQARFDRISQSGGPEWLRDLRLESVGRSLRNVAEETGRLRIAQAEALRQADEYAQTSEDNIEANEAFERSLSQTTDALEDQTKAVRANLREQRQEYNKARRDQISIEKEFQDLIRAVTTDEVTAEDVSLGDVFGRLNQAIAASERGNLDEAIRLAREGADFLTLLDEKGTETQGTLGFLAKQLSQVATEAAAARTEAERGDVTGAEAVSRQLEAQTESVKQIGDETGRAYAQSLLAGAQEILNQNVLQPQVAAPAPAPASQIRRTESGWSDGTDAGEVLRRNVDQQGNK